MVYYFITCDSFSLNLVPQVRNWPKPVTLSEGAELGDNYTIGSPHNACFFIGLEADKVRARGGTLDITYPTQAFKKKCLQTWEQQGVCRESYQNNQYIVSNNG